MNPCGHTLDFSPIAAVASWPLKTPSRACNAGSITAAQFLQRFVDDGRAWAHLDIAGTAWKPGNDNPLEPTWATGWGVRILDRMIADNYED